MLPGVMGRYPRQSPNHGTRACAKRKTCTLPTWREGDLGRTRKVCNCTEMSLWILNLSLESYRVNSAFEIASRANRTTTCLFSINSSSCCLSRLFMSVKGSVESKLALSSGAAFRSNNDCGGLPVAVVPPPVKVETSPASDAGTLGWRRVVHVEWGTTRRDMRGVVERKHAKGEKLAPLFE